MNYASPSSVETLRTPTRPRWWVILLILAAVGLVFGWLAAGVYLYFRSSGPIAPGVRVGQTEVGGLTLEQAAARIDNEWNRDKVLLVTDGTTYWQARPLEFGLWVDPAASARRAFDYGRGEQRWRELPRILLGIQPPEIQPVVVFSPKIAAEQLSYWGPLVDRAPEPARLVYADGRWSAAAGAPGLKFDPQATLTGMAENQTLVMLTGLLPLSVVPVPSPVEALQAELARLEAELNRPLTVRAYDPIRNEAQDFTVPRETLASWLRVEGTNLTLDESGFTAYVASLQSQVSDGRTLEALEPPYNLTEHWQKGEPVSITLRHPASTYTVQAGDTLLKIAYRAGLPFWMILDANPGLSAENIVTGQTITLPSKSDLLPLPVVPGKRIVLSIDQQRMWIYENNNQIREFVISTGIDRSPTQPGVFQIRTHDLEAYASVWDLYMPHFMGIYEAWPGFMNGIHGLPTLSNGTRLWASILGRPASYGCIILNLADAEWLYDWAEAGVVVEIQA